MKKYLVLFYALFLIPNFANAKEWKIDASQSKIEFTTMQNNSKITGSFKKFSGLINFDRNNLTGNKIDINIDISSVEASLSDAVLTLKTDAWFNLAKFPTANFKAEKFTKISDKKFKADGKLTIKGATIPLVLEFTFDEYSPSKAKAGGKTIIRRADFGIGAKDPANAHGVKDEVEVNFVIVAN